MAVAITPTTVKSLTVVASTTINCQSNINVTVEIHCYCHQYNHHCYHTSCQQSSHRLLLLLIITCKTPVIIINRMIISNDFKRFCTIPVIQLYQHKTSTNAR